MRFRRIHLLLFVALLCTLLVVTQRTDLAAQTGQGNVGFKWGFGVVGGKDRKFAAVTRDTVLRTGDELKFIVELTKNCYAYLVYQNSKGEIELLFPYSLNQFTTDYKTGKNYFIPQGRSWFKLDENTGRETFYLLASADRLTDLESLLKEYSSADVEKKSDLAQKIIKEIRDVRKRYRTFQTIAERPIAIGGNVRSVGRGEEARRPDVTTIATEITADNFYGKTYTIEHQ